MLPVILVYAGLSATALGLLTVLKPWHGIGIPTRRRAVLLALVGVVLIAVGWTLPAPATRIENPRTQLDRFAPAYQFSEFHSVRVNAPPDRVYRAVKDVTVDEIVFFRSLTWLRRAGRARPVGILNPPPGPALEAATRSSFLLLADEPSREVVIGTVVLAPRSTRLRASLDATNYSQVNAPGVALATMNFRLEPTTSGGTLLTTETRVFATDARARRAFARYWRVIYPGSALLRRMWLRAIKRRADR